MILPKSQSNISPFLFPNSSKTRVLPCQACPVCGCDNVHICDVEIGREHSRICAGEKVCSITENTSNSRYYGLSVTLCFGAECGHKFAYTWAFHKGNTTVVLHELGDGGEL